MSWFVTTACVLFPVYFCIDLNYFIRLGFTIFFAKLRRKIVWNDSSTIYGIVLTTDIDYLLTHMNNARFLREMDFARIDIGVRSGFIQEVLKGGGGLVLSSSFIRYRLPLPLFSRYKIETSVVTWNEKNAFLTHKLITLNDGIARAVIFARSSTIKVSVREIAEKLCPGVPPPSPEEIPEDYRKWMETLELSSQLMRASLKKDN